MQEKPFDINSLRVASPCSVGWETMTGDERVRHCSSCQLNIYNTAEMTAREVQKLISSRESRLCIRMHRRADGTVITKDCPVGLRGYRRRLTRSIGATLSLILGFVWTGFSQKPESPGTSAVVVETPDSTKNAGARLKGIVADPNGAVISGASLVLYRGKAKSGISKTSDNEGSFYFADISPETYSLDLSYPGFKRLTFKNLKLEPGMLSEINLTLSVAEGSVTVGIFAGDSPIDLTSSTVTTTITTNKIRLIPHE